MAIEMEADVWVEERLKTLSWELGITWEDNWDMMEELETALYAEAYGEDVGE